MKHSLLFIVAISMMVSCTGGSSENHTAADGHGHNDEPADPSSIELTETQMKTVGIKMSEIEKREMATSLRANGQLKVNPEAIADVTPLLAGKIVRLPVVEGQHIAKGQTLAIIENLEIATMIADFNAAEADSKLADAELKRQEALASAGAGIRKNLEAAQAASAVATSRLDAAKSRLDEIGVDLTTARNGKKIVSIPVKSPISGVVTTVSARVGAYADGSTPMMTITDNSALYAALDIYEKDVVDVKPGMNVDLRLTNAPDRHLTGVVTDVNQSIDPQSRTVTARVRLTGDISGLIRGMDVTAMISRGMEKVDALPSDAIVESGGRSYVFRLKDNHGDHSDFERIEVIAGVTALGYTAVTFTGNVNPDDRFVTAGAFYLSSMSSDHGEHSH